MRFSSFMIFTILIFQSSVVYAVTSKFVKQLNSRIEKINQIKREKGIIDSTPKQTQTKKHEAFLKTIEGKVSPSEYQNIKADLEKSRNTTLAVMNKRYDEKMKRSRLFAKAVKPTVIKRIDAIQNSIHSITQITVKNDPKAAKSSGKMSFNLPVRNQPSIVTKKKEEPENVPEEKIESDFFADIPPRAEDYVLQEYRRDLYNIDRQDDDGLFTIISKAYKRNIQRINTIKKKEEKK